MSMRKNMIIVWLNCDDELPNNNEKVLVVYYNDIKTAIFEKGISLEEREKMKKGEILDTVEWGWCLSQGYISNKRSDIIKSCDEFGNNTNPYCWRIDGHSIFGKNIKYWAHIPNIKELQGGEI